MSKNAVFGRTVDVSGKLEAIPPRVTVGATVPVKMPPMTVSGRSGAAPNSSNVHKLVILSSVSTM